MDRTWERRLSVAENDDDDTGDASTAKTFGGVKSEVNCRLEYRAGNAMAAAALQVHANSTRAVGGKYRRRPSDGHKASKSWWQTTLGSTPKMKLEGWASIQETPADGWMLLAHSLKGTNSIPTCTRYPGNSEGESTGTCFLYTDSVPSTICIPCRQLCGRTR
ncbi:hypothetical protein BCR44DRAFT_348713 [Catenaria anguillulae PL171]|uniref:Uncharacterized protein n=1 Tax=Catenaria anguillulae PL171 TaxID=765915 RepID=A0A1Y2I2W5_9FUNG|nr:hypothetical protein BCR44DRAFT_348713 [Catenaria anguillulae PL171]